MKVRNLMCRAMLFGSLFAAAVIFEGCSSSNDPVLPELTTMTAPQKANTQEAATQLKLVDQLLGSASTSSAFTSLKASSLKSSPWSGEKRSKQQKETLAVDNTIDLATQDPNSSGSVQVMGSITIDDTDTALSATATLTVTIVDPGITYTDPTSGDTLTLKGGTITSTLNVGQTFNETSLTGSVTVALTFSGVMIEATIGGKTITATVSRTQSLTVNVNMALIEETATLLTGTLESSVSVSDTFDLTWTVDGESHTLSTQSDIAGNVNGTITITVATDELASTPPLTLTLNRSTLTVDGVAFSDTNENLNTEFGLDLGVDEDGLTRLIDI